MLGQEYIKAEKATNNFECKTACKAEAGCNTISFVSYGLLAPGRAKLWSIHAGLLMFWASVVVSADPI